jgi:hypothetical protein
MRQPVFYLPLPLGEEPPRPPDGAVIPLPVPLREGPEYDLPPPREGAENALPVPRVAGSSVLPVPPEER